MQDLILKLTLGLVQRVATSDEAKELYDTLLDQIEDFIADSETKIDDTFLLPAIQQIRKTFDIPDND